MPHAMPIIGRRFLWLTAIVAQAIAPHAIAVRAAGTAAQPAEAASRTSVQWKPEEIRLTAQDEHAWWTFPAKAVFTHRDTKSRLDLEAWWDGGTRWVVRFAAPLAGATTYSLTGGTLLTVEAETGYVH